MTRERRTIPLMREHSAAARDCPLAPPAHASVYSRTLHRACLILGGVGQLAVHLEVTEIELRHWMGGVGGAPQPPEAVFLRAVEVLLLHVASKGSAN
ncbi:MAG TPA: hypothetical protein VGO02_01265 [Burkholderiales bacterium]|jgi:hypothetical protein|nr:hypothetical protein [Burkholderiales bacterium]